MPAVKGAVIGVLAKMLLACISGSAWGVEVSWYCPPLDKRSEGAVDRKERVALVRDREAMPVHNAEKTRLGGESHPSNEDCPRPLSKGTTKVKAFRPTYESQKPRRSPPITKRSAGAKSD